MSQYEEIDGAEGFICPYCKKSQGYESEDDGQDGPEDCSYCGKTFYAMADISVIYSSRPDCNLNGEQHAFEPYDEEFDKCSVCGTYRWSEPMEVGK